MKIQIEKTQAQNRLDVFLSEYLDKTRSHISSLNKEGNILVNNRKEKNGYILKDEDIIEITLQIPIKLEALQVDYEVVYEDDYLMVVNKPKGLVVHPASSYKKPTLVHGLLNKISIKDNERPGIVHRIDKDTSGLLLVAKNEDILHKLSSQLKEHKVDRIYYALVCGVVPIGGTIETYISRDIKNRTKYSVASTGKLAITHYEVIQNYDNYTLLKVILETGRTHQIRVHMAHIGHPVYGDYVYGSKKNLEGQYLHAKSIGFIHPITNKYMFFDSKLPEYFDNFLKELI
jgi:23S rRNA pseudouridine1911/1915/1917 synthase